jgi:hypothetical protein
MLIKDTYEWAVIYLAMLKHHTKRLVKLRSLMASKTCRAKGMLAHTMLMVDAETEQTIGLAEQHRWCRKCEYFGTKHQRKQRRYKRKL